MLRHSLAAAAMIVTMVVLAYNLGLRLPVGSHGELLAATSQLEPMIVLEPIELVIGEEPDAAEHFSPDQVRSALLAAAPSVHACLSNNAREPRLDLTLDGETGRITTAHLSEGPRDQRTSECLSGALSGAHFPQHGSTAITLSDVPIP